MGQTIFTSLLQELENDLDSLTYENHPVHYHTHQALGLCLLKYNDLRKYVINTGFMTNAEEVVFFKTIKPQVCSKLVFYRRLARIESHRPKYTMEDQIVYLKDEIKKLHEYYSDYSDFYEYYQTGKTYNDILYFTRNQTEIILNNRNSDYLTDPEFSTIHDKTVATIIAYENLEKYLNNEIQKVLNSSDEKSLSNSNKVSPKYNWSGAQVDYVEFLYAISESGIINNGVPGIKELHDLFSRILILPETDIYLKLQDIKKRKKSKTILLDKLKSALLRKLDDLDEFTPED